MTAWMQRTRWLLILLLLVGSACHCGEPPRQSDASPSDFKRPRRSEGEKLNGNCQATDPAHVLERFKVATEGGLLLLPVELQGKQYRFVLDTGASIGLYDTSLRSILGMPIKSVTMKTTDQGRGIPIFRSPAGTMGKLRLPADSECLCMDLRKLRELSGQDFYGLVGMDFLRKHVFRIDFDRGEITFLRSVGPNPGQRIPIIFRGNKPHVMIEARGLRGRGRFLVDTGSAWNGSGSLQSEAFAILAKQGFLSLDNKVYPETLAGSVTRRVGRVDAISLGNFRHERLSFTESNKNLLGLSYWTRYVVTFDFPNSVMYLKKGCQFSRPELRDLSGLVILRKKGQTLVISVEKGSPAAKAGVKPWDVLLEIDDVKTCDMSLWGIRRLLCAEGKKFRILVLRVDKKLKITIALQ